MSIHNNKPLMNIIPETVPQCPSPPRKDSSKKRGYISQERTDLKEAMNKVEQMRKEGLILLEQVDSKLQRDEGSGEFTTPCKKKKITQSSSSLCATPPQPRKLSFELFPPDPEELTTPIFGFSAEVNEQKLFALPKNTGDANRLAEPEKEEAKTQLIARSLFGNSATKPPATPRKTPQTARKAPQTLRTPPPQTLSASRKLYLSAQAGTIVIQNKNVDLSPFRRDLICPSTRSKMKNV